jgi:hypothetical protein
MTYWKHNLIGFIASVSCIAFIVFQIDIAHIKVAISMFGLNEDQSASFAFLSHLLLWLPTTIVGAILIFFNPKLFKLNNNI